MTTTRMPLRDWIARAIIGALLALLVSFIMLWLFAPGVLAVVLHPRISGVCTVGQAIRGLEKHRLVRSGAGGVKDRSVMVSRDASGYSQWRTPQGMYWVPQMTSEALFVLLSQQAAEIYQVPETSIRPGDIVLDCGAHVGVFTRDALSRGAKLVVAIEPAPENLECLRRNFPAEIAAGRVVVYPKGVWHREEILPMYSNRNSAGDSFVLELDPGQKSVSLPVTTIDRIVEELRLERVDFIKMDIKGAEVKALRGAGGVLRGFRPRLAVAAEHLSDDPEAIPAAVRSANSEYRAQCGICYVGGWATKPEVLHFF